MTDAKDHSLFQQFMRDVKPLKKRKTIEPVIEKPAPKKTKITATSLDLPQTQDNLDKHYNSQNKKLRPYKPVHPTVTINYSADLDEPITSETILKYQTQNLSPNHLDKLVKGQVHIDARIDLHGLERFEAQDRLHRFLDHAKSHGLRMLLIIHGKGSKHGETPILKTHLYLWLRQYPYLLAMHSAHSKHGGSGALYVLLKKAQK